MDEQFSVDVYAEYCESIAALRKRGEWKQRYSTFEDYAKERWSLSKSRVQLVCKFVAFRRLVAEQKILLPETPEQVKAILSLPKKQWLETWEIVVDLAEKGDINERHVIAVMQRFGIGSRKRLPPEVLKGIRVRRAAKTLAEIGDGEKLVSEIGKRGLGKRWNDAVRVVIDADTAAMNEEGR